MNEEQQGTNALPASSDVASGQRRRPAVLRPAYQASTHAALQAVFDDAGYPMEEIDEAEAVSHNHIEALRQLVDERRATLEEIAQMPGADPQRTVGFRVDGRFTPAELQRMGFFPASQSFNEIADMRRFGSLMGSATVEASNYIFAHWANEHGRPPYQYVLDLQGIDVAGWVDGDGAEPIPASGERYDFEGMDEIHIGPVPVSRVGLLDSSDPVSRRLIAELVGANLHNAQRGVPLDTFVDYQQWSRTDGYAAACAGGRNPALDWTGASALPATIEFEEDETLAGRMQRFLGDDSVHDANGVAEAIAAIDQLRQPGAWDIPAGDLVPATVVQLPNWPVQRGLVIYNEQIGSLIRYDAQGTESHDAASVDPANDVVLIHRELQPGMLHYDVGRWTTGPQGPQVEHSWESPADGDCLINALLHAEPGLAAGADAVTTLRNQLADYMQDHLDTYRHYLIPEPQDEPAPLYASTPEQGRHASAGDLSLSSAPSLEIQRSQHLSPSPSETAQATAEPMDPVKAASNLIRLCEPVSSHRRAAQVAEVAQELADLAAATPEESASVLLNPQVSLGLVRLSMREALHPPAGSSAHSNAAPLSSMVAQSLRRALPYATDETVMDAVAGPEVKPEQHLKKQKKHAPSPSERQPGVAQELLSGRGHQALQPLAELVYGEIAHERCRDLLRLPVYDESSRNLFTGSRNRKSLESVLKKDPVIGSFDAARSSVDRRRAPAEHDLHALNAQIQRNVHPQQAQAGRVHAAAKDAAARQHQREAEAQQKRARVKEASRAALGTLLASNQLHEDRRQVQYAEAKEHSAQIRAEQRDQQAAARQCAKAQWIAQSSASNLAAGAAAHKQEQSRKSQRDAIRMAMSRPSGRTQAPQQTVHEGALVAGMSSAAPFAGQADATTMTLHPQGVAPPLPAPLQVQQHIVYRADGTTEAISMVVPTPGADQATGQHRQPQPQKGAGATPRSEMPSGAGAGRIGCMADLRRDQETEQVHLVRPMIRIEGAYVPFGPDEVVNPPVRIPGRPNPWVPGPDVDRYQSLGAAQLLRPSVANAAPSLRAPMEPAARPLGGSRLGPIEQRQAAARQLQDQHYRSQGARSGAPLSTHAQASARQQRIDEAAAEVAGASTGKPRGMER